jgi:hypothetical protein
MVMSGMTRDRIRDRPFSLPDLVEVLVGGMFDVMDMSSTWSPAGDVRCSLGAEVSGELVGEGPVLGSEAGDFFAVGVELLAQRIGGGQLALRPVLRLGQVGLAVAFDLVA